MSDVNASIGINFDTSTALAQLKNLQRELSQFHTSIVKSSAAAGMAQAQLQKDLLNSINATGQFASSMVTVKTSTESFTHALETNKLSMGQYFRYAVGSTRTFGNLFRSEFDTISKVAEDRVKTLQTQYIKMGRDANGSLKAMAIRPLTLDMADFATQTQIAAQKQAIFGQLLKQGSTNLLNFGKNTQWAGRQLMVGFSIPLLALGTSASKAFMEMEAAALKFKKVYGDLGTSPEETKAQLDSITALANGFTQYGIAASKTVGLASEAAAAGFQGIDLQRQTAEATRLSVLGQIDAQQALETTISLQNAFNTSSADLADSINFLNAVENQTVTSLDDITTAIPKVAPVINSLGGNVKDLAFFLTAMKEGGINATEGANALKSGLAALINPTKSASDMLATYGINVGKIVEGNRGNLKATVVEFAQALDKLDPLARARAIEQMFGKFQFARISTLLQNITREGTQAERVLGLANASASELANTANKELGLTAESAMNKFKKAVEDLKVAIIPVGEAFLEAVTPIVEFVGNILEKFAGLPAGIKKAITLISVIVGGLGPVVLMSFGLLANGVANIIKLFASLRNGFLAITGRSRDLGEQTKYLNAEQLEATTIAASLNQAHSTLTQSFTAEATAVNALRNAYISAADAAKAFAFNNPGMMAKGARKFSDGGIVNGPGGPTDDKIQIMASNGEAIIPASTVNANREVIDSLLRTGQYKPRIDLTGSSTSPRGTITNGGLVPQRTPQEIEARNARALAQIEASRARREAIGSAVAAPIMSAMTTTPTKNNPEWISEMAGMGKGQSGQNAIANYLFQEIEKITKRVGPGLVDEFKVFVEDTAKGMQQVTKTGLDKALKEQRVILEQYSPQSYQQEKEQFAHIGSGLDVTARDLQSSGAVTNKATLEKLNQLAAVLPDKKVGVKTGFGFGVRGDLNNALGEAGASLQEVVTDFQTRGIDKWKKMVQVGGGNFDQMTQELTAYDQEMSRLLQQRLSAGATTIVDTKAQVDQARAKALAAGESFDESLYVVVEEVNAEAIKNLNLLGTGLNDVIQTALETITEIRLNLSAKEDAALGGNFLGTQNGQARLSGRLTPGGSAAFRKYGGAGTVNSQLQASAIQTTDGLINTVEKTAGVQSPSKRTIPIGEDIARGLQVGMDKQSANVANSAKNMTDAAIRGTESSTELYGKTGYISPIEKSIRRQNELRMKDLPSRSVVNKDAFTIAVQEEKQRRVNIAGLDKMNKAIMGGTFALTSIAAAGQMAGGSLGQISNQVMKYSGALYALMTVTQLVTQTKIAELAIGRLAAAKQAAAFASYGSGLFGKAGMLGSVLRFGLAIKTFLGPIGLVTTGLLGAYSIIRKVNATREEERKNLQAFGETLKSISGASKVLGSYFGYEPVKSLYESTPSLTPKTVQQTSDMEGFQASEQFSSKEVQSIIDNVKRLTTKKEITSAMVTAGYEMMGTGASKENVQTFIDSILDAAGKSNIIIDFKSLKISKNNIDSIIKEYSNSIGRLDKAYKGGKTEEMRFENPDGTYRKEIISSNPKLRSELKNQSATISTFGKSIALAFQQGQISSDVFLRSFKTLNKEITTNTPNSEEAIRLLSMSMALTDKPLAKMLLAFEDYNSAALVMQARTLGIAFAQKDLSLLAADTSGDLILAAAQVAKAAEIEQQVIDRLAGINSENDKKSSLTDKDKVNDLKKRTQELREQNKVMIALRKSGIDYATAQDLASDAGIRAMLLSAKSAGLNSKKWKDAIAQVKKYAEVSKSLQQSLIAGQDQGEYEKSRLEMAQSYIALQEQLIDMQNRPQLAKYDAEMESINTQLDDIKIKEDEINKAYELQAKTLTNIKSINDAMAASDQKRLSVANALTSGDISEAAQAVQDSRAQSAANAMDIAQEALSLGRDKSVSALGGDILEKQLTALQKQKKALEDNIQAEKNRIKWLGMTKDEINAAVTALDLAQNANIDINDPNFLNNILKGAKGDSEALGIALKDVAKQAQAALNKLASLRTTSYNMNTATGNVFDGTPFGQSGNNKVASNSLDFYPTPYVGTPFGQTGSAAAKKAKEQAALLGTPFGQMSMGGWVPRYFANGGLSKGTDIIPAMLTPGEFVVNKNAAGKFGPLLQQLNSSRYPDSLSFGGTPSVTAVSSNNVNNSSTVYNYSLNVTANSNNASPDDIARTVIAQIRGLEAQRIRGNR